MYQTKKKNSQSENIKLFKNNVEIKSEKLFEKAEKLLTTKLDFYSKTLFPLTNLYLPNNLSGSLLLSLGILAGIIIEKEKYKIIPSNNMELNNVIFK